MTEDNQQPTLEIEPPRAGSDGEAAALLFKSYAFELDPWQKHVLNAWLALDENGNYISTSAGISCPRQNGKTALLCAFILFQMLVNGAKVLFCCHQMKTGKKTFQFLTDIFENREHPEIREAVRNIRRGAGEEQITLNNGGSVDFIARTRQGARGFSGISVLIHDEAQEVTDTMASAVTATLSASATGQRQVIYAGTPVYAGCSGETFRNFRNAMLAVKERGAQSKNCWHEWGVIAEDITEIDAGNRDLWARVNPSLRENGRLSYEFTQTEYETLSNFAFCVERLGFWMKPKETAGEIAIAPQLWDSCRSGEAIQQVKTAYGVKFSMDGASVALAAACYDKEQQARIELIAHEPLGNGITWLVKWLNDRVKIGACVVIDGKQGAGMLADRLAGTWIFKGSVITPTAANVTTAAQTLLTELTEHSVTWYEAQTELREAAITCNKRAIGGAFGFGGGSCPEAIEACSLALWGLRTSKRNPQRKMRLVF